MKYTLHTDIDFDTSHADMRLEINTEYSFVAKFILNNQILKIGINACYIDDPKICIFLEPFE